MVADLTATKPLGIKIQGDKKGTKVVEEEETYFWVDKKLIFHLPTLPEPCWDAVLAGE